MGPLPRPGLGQIALLAGQVLGAVPPFRLDGAAHPVPVPLDPPHTAPADAILLADGVFLQRPELDRFWDLRIYLDIGLEESLRRGVDRDRHWMGGAAVAERRYRTKYLPGEQRYLAEVRPHERAQIVVDTTDPARPRIIAAL